MEPNRKWFKTVLPIPDTFNVVCYVLVVCMLLNELLKTKCVFNAGIHAYEVFFNMHWYGDIMDTRVIDCNNTHHNSITSCASLIITRENKNMFIYMVKQVNLCCRIHASMSRNVLLM